MSYQSFEQILQKCHTEGKEFWQVILEDDMAERNVSKQDSMEHMRTTWDAMLLAAATYEGDIKSSSGLVGGDGQRMEEYTHNTGKESLCGEYVDECIAGALQMGESNACMKRIVAAPTAGACGVLPAVLVPYFQKRCRDTDKILKAMYVAAGIGQIIATRSSISGAAGGCQAEIGSASSMAAGALTYLQGGNCEQIATSAAMAMKNLLGLVCDPVAGLVEVPCVKRNVIGTVNAMACADMAMAGIVSRIPPDQVMDAMKEAIHSPLLETDLQGASHVLINCSAGLNLVELNTAISYVQEIVGNNADIIWGTVSTDENPDDIAVTLIATGFSTPTAKEHPSILPKYSVPLDKVPATASLLPPKPLESNIPLKPIIIPDFIKGKK